MGMKKIGYNVYAPQGRRSSSSWATATQGNVPRWR